MRNVRFGEICELSYFRSTGPCLPHLVRELSERLCAAGLTSIQLTWDCDDIAVFEIPGHRIILAISDAPNTGGECRLLVSVGPVPDEKAGGGSRLAHAALCRRIARGIERKHPADKTQTRSWPGVLTPERVDDLLYAPTQFPAKITNLHDFVAPLRSEVLAEDKKLRSALVVTPHRSSGRFMAAGLLINGLARSMAAATPGLLIAIFGSGLISKVVWAATTQLPR